MSRLGLLARLGFVDRSGVVSKVWLKEQHRTEREDFHAPCWSWPVNKRFNELAWMNRTKLRKVS